MAEINALNQNNHVTGNFDFEEDDGYEYSQPITLHFNNASGAIRDVSPFGIDSEVGILYYSSNDAAAVTLVGFDMDFTQQAVAAIPSKIIGQGFYGAVNGAPFTPIFSPIKSYISIAYNSSTSNAHTMITLMYRRHAEVTVPHDETFWGDTNE